MKKFILKLAVVIFFVYDALVVAMLMQKPNLWQAAKANPNPSPAKQNESVWFDSLVLISSSKIKTSMGTKSLLSSGEYVFAFNLESANVDVFESKSKKHLARLAFALTAAKGFDYTTRKTINSFAEKPVEAALSHNKRFLWISLHNAQGVVVWDTENQALADSLPFKQAKLQTDSGSFDLKMPYFKTGDTPKFILVHDSLVFVSNWHSNTVSVISASGDRFRAWKKIKDIPVGKAPRGLAIWRDTLWVANMGQNYLSAVVLDKLEVVSKLEVGPTPRHLLAYHSSLYVTLSSPEQFVRLHDNKMSYSQTCDDPRTAIECGGIFFVACYGSHFLQAFHSNVSKLGEWKTAELPIGLVGFARDSTVEIWVSHYKTGYLTVMNFQKNPPFGRQN